MRVVITPIKFLGYIVSYQVVEMMYVKVESLDKIEPSKTLKYVLHILGFANFYRRFVKD